MEYSDIFFNGETLENIYIPNNNLLYNAKETFLDLLQKMETIQTFMQNVFLNSCLAKSLKLSGFQKFVYKFIICNTEGFYN